MGDLRPVLNLTPRFEATIVTARDQSIVVGHELDLVDLVKRVWVTNEGVESEPLENFNLSVPIDGMFMVNFAYLLVVWSKCQNFNRVSGVLTMSSRLSTVAIHVSL